MVSKLKYWENSETHISYIQNNKTVSGSSVGQLVSNPMKWYNNLQIIKSNNKATAAMMKGIEYEQKVLKSLLGDKNYNNISHEDENGNQLPYMEHKEGYLDLIGTFDAIDIPNKIIYEVKTTKQSHTKFLEDAKYQLALYLMLSGGHFELWFITYNPEEKLSRENIDVTKVNWGSMMTEIVDIKRAIKFVKETIWDYETDKIVEKPKLQLQVPDETRPDNLVEIYEDVQTKIKELNKQLREAKQNLEVLTTFMEYEAATDKTFAYRLTWNTRAIRKAKSTIEQYEFTTELERR